MSANDRTDGLLKALQDLPEADRDRIVKHLPPEEVQNVFSLLLRKQNGAPAPQPQPLVNNAPALTQAVTAVGSIGVPKKRGRPAGISNASKRTKTDATGQQKTGNAAAHVEVKKGQEPATAEAVGQQETDNATARVLVKKEQEIIDLISDDEEPEPEPEPELEYDDQRNIENDLPEQRQAQANRKPTNLPSQLKPRPTRKPVDLPMYLQLRNERGKYVLKDFDDLPVLVQAELKRRYEEMCSATEYRRRYYGTCTLNPKHYTDSPHRPFCIRNILVSGGIRAGRTRQEFSQGGVFKKTADDRCINARQPCSHFAKYKEEFIIRIVPLPRTLREGKTWTDLGYWVL
ncbi:hypothetical protein J4E93_000736 [Alternaria ventricosa]|uniref:uncharacterized protein n=1 Tax=Alternaria ventricosa TaxID=1187951 RepID=UPI0020C2333E|nr:uncharacterized protein J4E93_000736 [Alternaria ventricosa]KAI4656020.1 hypothetical protein J4E93_000736 [Alternaria ventricosa]